MEKMTHYRWTICTMMFFALAINYMDRQVLSLTWDEFIKPEFHWTDWHYGIVTATFSIVYALGMLFAGRFIDWMGSRKGYLWSIGIWSAGACLHAFCGIATESIVGFPNRAALVGAVGDTAVLISTISMYFFLAARCVLAIGEAGNFPVAVKVTAEYFPKRDRAYATSIFNAGASIGALVAPLTIPLLAKHFGWELSFVIIGVLGFIWMGFWVFLYTPPAQCRFVNKAELEYIEQDKVLEAHLMKEKKKIKSISIWKAITYRQTWAFGLGKFFTDGVWWFFLFWTPSYIHSQFGIKMSSPEGMGLMFTLYAIVMLSIFGGKLPTYFINRNKENPYAARMRAMLIFAFIPLVVLFAQPLGGISPWLPIILIGVCCAAHQSWSANVYTTVSDMFPKNAVATVTGIGGMAGGISSFLFQLGAGYLFDYAERSNLHFLNFEGKPAGYFIIFCVCSVAYLVGWTVMKALVPKYKLIQG